MQHRRTTVRMLLNGIQHFTCRAPRVEADNASPVDCTGAERLFEDLLLKPKGGSVALRAVQSDFAYVRRLWYERAQQIDFRVPLGHDLWMQS